MHEAVAKRQEAAANDFAAWLCVHVMRQRLFALDPGGDCADDCNCRRCVPRRCCAYHAAGRPQSDACVPDLSPERYRSAGGPMLTDPAACRE